MMDSSSSFVSLSRQPVLNQSRLEEELTALLAIFNDGSIANDDDDEQQALTSMVCTMDSSHDNSSRTLHITPHVARRSSCAVRLRLPTLGPQAHLLVTVPTDGSYPSDTDSVMPLNLKFDNVTHVDEEAVSAMNNSLLDWVHARTVVGGEYLLELLQYAAEVADDVAADAIRDADAHVTSVSGVSAGEAETSPRLSYRVIHSHHIIAKGKRTLLSDLARELDIGGYVKVGWPGAIVVEGTKENVDAYVQEILRLSWKQIRVRWEGELELTKARCFARGVVVELHDPGGMKALKSAMADGGLPNDLFDSLLLK